MTHPIPTDAQRMADRLRLLADEIESAARYGVPIPNYINVSGHEYGAVTVSAEEHEFAAWAEYTEAEVRHDHHHGAWWSDFATDVNGLPLRFAVRHEAEAVTA